MLENTQWTCIVAKSPVILQDTLKWHNTISLFRPTLSLDIPILQRKLRKLFTFSRSMDSAHSGGQTKVARNQTCNYSRLEKYESIIYSHIIRLDCHGHFMRAIDWAFDYEISERYVLLMDWWTMTVKLSVLWGLWKKCTCPCWAKATI